MGRWLARPWVWVLIVAVFFSFPLVKSLNRELPDAPPGIDSRPADFLLPDNNGANIHTDQLRGRLLVVTELTLVNITERDRAFAGIRALRKRMRNLGHLVVYVVLCHGGTVAEVDQLLDERKARKPVNLFLMDEGHEQMDILRRTAGSASARFFLLDRHGRIRGAFDDRPSDIDALVDTAGLLANWEGADPPPD